MPVPTITVLRNGAYYRSLDTQSIPRLGTEETAATVTFANSGLIKRDLASMAAAHAALRKFKARDLLDITLEAADHFLNSTLPVGAEEYPQSPDDYVRALSSTGGLPHSLLRMNMKRLHHVLTQVPTIFKGLSRGLDPEALDSGFYEQNGVRVSFTANTDVLGVVLPSNSPAVNALWAPSIAMKIPVILKPGREEPWTPWRMIQAFIKAGAPREAFGFYPADHEGSNAIIRRSGRVMLFGGDDTVRQHENDPRVEVHGAGRSKILLGDDEIENWRDYLDIMVHSVSANSGRSCINASCIVVPKYGDEIAAAVAERLVGMVPRDAEDPEANLSGFANPKMSEWIDGAIESGLAQGGARDISLALRKGEPRYQQLAGMHYLVPTITRCDSIEHSLGNTEFLFPYASVIEMPQVEMLGAIGKSLAVAAITRDKAWIDELIAASHIERLNVGPMATNHVEWDQPHEGNLFEFLYKRRSIQVAHVAA